MLHERFKILIDKLGFKPNEFAKKLGFDRADNIHNVLNNKTKGSTELFEIIANTFDKVNLNWLITGKGEKFIDDKHINNNCSLIEAKDDLIKSKEETIHELKGRVSDLQNHIKTLEIHLEDSDIVHKKENSRKTLE